MARGNIFVSHDAWLLASPDQFYPKPREPRMIEDHVSAFRENLSTRHPILGAEYQEKFTC